MDNATVRVTDKTFGLGLALSGGGSKGFAHLGAFKAIEEFGMKPEIIAGTSVGALMGVLYADGYKPEEIAELFKGKEFKSFAEFQMPRVGIFSSQGFRKFLKAHLHAKHFEELAIPLIAVATDLDNGQSVNFDKGPLIEVITASCSIPLIFNPVVISGIHYVDGGLFRNFPVSVIRDECETVIGVNVSPLIPMEYKQTLLHIAERSYHYMFKANTLKDRMLCDVLVENREFGEFKTFDLENIDVLFDLGYNATVEALRKKYNSDAKNSVSQTMEQ
ncbi:MAG: patatin-like phospholipase family protein [Bacteroidales bacterium]|nr:patatin-like phospholipase family protein [Bacteroidales bacterium]